jgi:hypothetical protein
MDIEEKDTDIKENQEKNITHMIDMMVLEEVIEFQREQHMVRNLSTKRRVNPIQKSFLRKKKIDHQDKRDIPEEVIDIQEPRENNKMKKKRKRMMKLPNNQRIKSNNHQERKSKKDLKEKEMKLLKKKRLRV